MNDLFKDLLKLTKNTNQAMLLNYLIQKGRIQIPLTKLGEEVFCGVYDNTVLYNHLEPLRRKGYIEMHFSLKENPVLEPNIDKITEDLQRLEESSENNIKPGDRVKTPCGEGTVVEFKKGMLWFT